MRRNNKRNIYFVAIFGLAILIGVGYAFLTQALNITGTTTINKSSWDVHFENLTTGVSGSDVSLSVIPSEITSAMKTTSLSFTSALKNPGDGFDITVDVVNAGTLDAMISSVSMGGLTDAQAKYISYTATWSDGANIATNQELKSGKSERITISVAFKKDITAVDLPTEEVSINLSFGLEYVQADEFAVAINHPVCKRATTLHTEVCNQSSGYCAGTGYATGDTITYGNLGTTGTLVSGDAFDCDVNGDEVFDSESERFYYVSDLDTNNDYAVLIYYNNVADGVANNEGNIYEYNSQKDTSYGPTIAMQQLPTTEQWKNISLSSTTRNIKDENGAIRVENFDYSGSAARLLSYQEVYNTCYDETIEITLPGSLKNRCEYLMENTKYALGMNHGDAEDYYLEGVTTNGSGHILDVYYSAHIGTQMISYGGKSDVRPAIEVLKTKISY